MPQLTLLRLSHSRERIRGRFPISTMRSSMLRAAILLSCVATASCRSGPPTKEVEILFVTDRQQEDDGSFGPGRADSLAYGLVPVSVWEADSSDSDAPSVFTAPARLRVGQPRFVSRDSFFTLFRRRVCERKHHQSFTFVHGFNNDFGEAVSRTALIERAMDFDWVGVAYSWPSYGKGQHYVADLDQARWTHKHLREYFRHLASAVEVERHSVAAHSMGSQALSWALDTAVFPVDARPRFATIALLAPDIDPDLLSRDHVPMFRSFARSIALYGDPHDKALRLSRGIRAGADRAGLIPTGRELGEGVDVMDISGVKSPSFLRHFDHLNGTTLADLMLAMWTGVPMKCRQSLRTAARDTADRQWKLAPVWATDSAAGGVSPEDDLPECRNSFAERPAWCNDLQAAASPDARRAPHRAKVTPRHTTVPYSPASTAIIVSVELGAATSADSRPIRSRRAAGAPGDSPAYQSF